MFALIVVIAHWQSLQYLIDIKQQCLLLVVEAAAHSSL